MTVYRAPITPGQVWFEDDGDPAAGGTLETFLAGTATPATTFTSATGLVANLNPLTLNAAGRLPAGIDMWFSGGVSYKLEVRDALGALLATADNLTGHNDPAFAAGNLTEWLDGPTATWISSSATVGTVATFVGDQRAIFVAGRRIRYVDAGGTKYGTVAATAYDLPSNTTTVTAMMDGGVTVANPITGSGYGFVTAGANISMPADPAPAWTLPDDSAAINRGHPASVYQTPTTGRVITLDASFLRGDRRIFINRAAGALTMSLQATDGTVIATLDGGQGAILEALTDAPGTSTAWRALVGAGQLVIGNRGSALTRDTLVLLADASRILFGTAAAKINWRLSAQDDDSRFSLGIGTTTDADPTDDTFNTRLSMDGNANLYVGDTTPPASVGGAIVQSVGTDATGNPVNAFAMWAKDHNGAATAWPYYRTEDGHAGYPMLAPQGPLLTRVLDIGDWNMTSTIAVNIAHALDWSKIRAVDALIRNDAQTITYSFMHIPTAVAPHSVTFDNTNVTLTRGVNSVFVGTDYDATSFNRGWIVICYVP